MKYLSYLCAALLLVGCETFYKQPSSDEPYASLELLKGYEKGVGFGAATSQAFYHAPEQSCNPRERIAYLTWTTGDSVIRRVKPGEELHLLAELSRVVVNTEIRCYNLVSFTPVEGHTYSAKQYTDEQTSCLMLVKDETENKIPSDIKITPVGTCGFGRIPLSN